MSNLYEEGLCIVRVGKDVFVSHVFKGAHRNEYKLSPDNAEILTPYQAKKIATEIGGEVVVVGKKEASDRKYD